MTTVEAAASLFGSEDPASDPFTALGTGPTAEETTTDSLFFDGHDTHATSAPSEHLTPAVDDPGHSQQDDHAHGSSTWLDGSASQYGYSGAGMHPEVPNIASSNFDQAQGWQSHGQQQHSYQPAAQTTPAAQGTGNQYDPYSPYSNYSATGAGTQHTHTYDPYAPATQATNNTQTSAVPASGNAWQAQMFDPYAPANQPAKNNIAAGTSTQPSPPTYNQYIPTVSNAQANSPPSYNSVQAPYSSTSISSTPAIPPPPAPTTTINRPKISNAYDPPFPTTRPARRGASRAGHSTGPATSSQYGAYARPSTSAGILYTSPFSRDTSPPTTYGVSGSSAPQSNNTRRTEWTQQTNTSSAERQPSYSNAAMSTGPSGIDGLPSRTADTSTWQAGVNHSTFTSNHSSYDLYSPPPSQSYAPQAAAREYASPPRPSVELSEPFRFVDEQQASHPAGQASHLNADIFPAEDPESTMIHPSASLSNISPPQQPQLTSSAPPAVPIDSRNRSHDVGPPKRTYTPNSYEPSSNATIPPSVSQGYQPSHEPVYSPYLPSSTSNAERASSPASSIAQIQTGVAQAAYDPYAPPPKAQKLPTNSHSTERVASPSSMSVKSLDSNKSLNHPPPPSNGVSRAPDTRTRSMSNGSVLSTASNSPQDPYAPRQWDRQQSHQSSESNHDSSSSWNSPHTTNEQPSNSLAPVHVYDVPGIGGQDVLAKPTHAPYAPSPSLMGTNDPLRRTSVRVPVVSFGFGGKLVTCFHGAASLNTGFDIALSSRNSTGVNIRVVTKIIPPSVLDTSTTSFPGPLFSDPGNPTTSLVRTGVSTQTKNKKARVMKYLTERAEEISRGLAYLHVDSAEGRHAEGKLVLVKLLKIMIENDGRLSGTPQIDAAVRTALVPHLENPSPDASNATMGLGFTSVADLQGSFQDMSNGETPISTTILRPSALEKIEEFLIKGERRQAYHYALDEKLWAHALVIASGIDKEAWKEAVNEFLKGELGVKPDNSPRGTGYTRPDTTPLATSGREGLRVAYSLFSGQGPSAVQELAPQTLLSRATGRLALPPPTAPMMTPMTPNFGAPAPGVIIPSATLAKWSEIVAMIYSNPLTPETSAALTALGDHLASNQWIEAAHVCYLLAPQTSPIGGVANPAARIILLSSRSPPVFSKDPDPIILTEILEFALSLVSPAKGQEAFSGLPHLQVYRLLRAMSLAEIGDIQLANRYCEAITASLSRPSPYFTIAFAEQLKGLTDRIIGVPNLDKSGSWIGGKLSKPSLDTIGGWLEGRFTKIITGDSDSATPPEEEIKTDSKSYVGPFSHYSTISSAIQSPRSSPKPSTINPHAIPPPRSGSAMATSSINSHVQIDRASSAMDHIRQKASPIPRVPSASAISTTSSQAPSFGQSPSEHKMPNGYSTQDTTPRLDQHADNHGQEVSWWGASGYGESSSTQTPTAATFLKVDPHSISESPDGFISLMDSNPYSVTPQPSSANRNHHIHHNAAPDDEEDLGFGNFSRKKRQAKDSGAQPTDSPKQEPEKPAASQPDAKPAASSGGWFWWWKNDAPKPVKANLGEETSFYYDKELKRWVNKRAGAEEASKPAAPPPPPSRPQTASPAHTMSRLSAGNNTGPPTRPASTIDLSTSPPSSKTIKRVHSNLAPPPGAESAPSTPTGTRQVPNGTPPPGRPKSQASKRNVRSRYIDVFAEGSGA